MITNMKSVIVGCMIKFTSIADKYKEDIITQEKSQELVLNLVEDTDRRILQLRTASFVTDN